MATERIIIEVSERGSRTVRRSLEDIGTTATRAEGGVQLLRRALGLLGGALAVRELVHMADTYTNLQNRLKLVTTGTANLARVTDELFSISNRTRSSFEGTANMYARVALSAKDLGVSQQELLNFTESLNQAVILSGASMREAEGALIQLSQGLASGTLQGDELRSILEQLPMVADVIAQHLGVTRGELRKMGADGKITGQIVLEAFRAARVELGEKFAETVPTIGQALQVLKNRAIELWGEFTTGSGVAQALAQALVWVAENLDNIIPLALTLGAIFAAWTIGSSIAAVVGPMIALQRALGATSAASAVFSLAMKGAQGAVMGLTAAIAANPIGAIAVAITAVLALLWTFSDDIKVTEDGAYSLRDVFVATFQVIARALEGVVAFFQTAWTTAVNVVNEIFAAFGTTAAAVLGAIGQFAKAVINAFIGMWVLAFRTVQLIWGNFPGFMDILFTAVVNLGAAAAEALLNAWQVPLRFIAGGLSQISDEAGAALSGFLDNASIRVPRRVAGGAGQQFAQDFASAATESLSRDYLGEFGNAVWAQMQENGPSNGQSGDLNEGGAARAIRETDDAAKAKRDLADAEADAQRALADFLREVDQDIALLGMSNRERERAARIYRLEDQMKRQLTATERALVEARLAEWQVAQDQDELRRMVQHLQDENELLALNTLERQRRAAVMDFERQIGRDATAQEREQIEGLVELNGRLREQADALRDIQGPMQEIGLRWAAINDLFDQGKISAREYQIAIRDLQTQALETFQATNWSEGFVSQWMRMEDASRSSLTNIGTMVGEIFGPGGTLSKGIGDAVAQAVVFGKSFEESVGDVARAIISQLISALVQIGVNMILQATLGKALMASSTAATVAAATASAAAWAPAAALASLATLGTNAAAASAAIIGTTALAKTVGLVGSLAGFEEGGFTGPGGRRQVAGLVHGQEFVAHAEATRRYRPQLEAMNRGQYRPEGARVSVRNYAPGVEHEVRERSDGEIEIIARRVLQREGPGVIAADMGSPNSRTSKAIRRTTTAQPRRS